jgi:hypothetical protein
LPINTLTDLNQLAVLDLSLQSGVAQSLLQLVVRRVHQVQRLSQLVQLRLGVVADVAGNNKMYNYWFSNI